MTPTTDADDEVESGAGSESPRINLQSALTRAVNAVSDDDGWALLPALGNQLIRTYPSFDARNFAGPGARLSTLITAQPYLETSGSGNALRVRLKGRKPAGRKAPDKSVPDKVPDKKVPDKKAPAQEATAKAPPQAAPPKVTTTTRAAKRAPSKKA